MGQYTTILDVGSSKVICLICSCDNANNIIVRGAGIREYSGFRRGEFVDEQQFQNAVVDALSKAEIDSKCKVRELSVGVPAPFIRLAVREGKVLISPRAKSVSPAEVELIMNDSLNFARPEGFELMHSTPIDFRIDQMPDEEGKRYAHAPVSNVFVDFKFRSLVTSALCRVGLGADMYIAVPLAEGMFMLSEEDKSAPAVLIDVGATFTEVSVIRNGALYAVKSIDIGGTHFTNDLAYAFDLPPESLENVKRRYVYSAGLSDSIDTIRLMDGGVFNVDHDVITLIMEARMDELADLIIAAMREMGATPKRSWPVYLTGGGITLMRGSCEYLEKKLGMPIKVDLPWTQRLSTSNYASAFSVMNFVIGADGMDASVPIGPKKQSKILDKLRDFFLK